MHSLLENYLADVEGCLASLPAARRDEELREMRQHLQNAVIVNRELGQSDEEATANALEQFGSHLDLGENIVWAWRREERKQSQRLSWRGIGLMASFCIFEGFRYPHDAGRLVFLFLFTALLVGWRHLPPKCVPAWFSSRRPLSPAQRMGMYACAAFMCLHPFYVPSLLWTHVLTPSLNVALASVFFYLRYREHKQDVANTAGPDSAPVV